MSLAPGTRIGPYEVQSALGAGGMGEVYRARDTKLGRDVALKILPDLFASDPERLARFEREARTLAALNHPHIAQIYGLEERALVMELVAGEDLSERIARGAIPLDEALPIAHQIADALQAAHEQGIIHRDLKPANIKVRPDGTVKVLDFGLAKALDPVVLDPGARDFSPANPLNSPTITSPAMTMRGMILGTAAYMAPEQAKGKSVDKRADIWAFGCVLYEMVTGARAFPGDDITEVLASVIKTEPDLARVPPSLRRALAACLAKDPNRRLRDIGDVWKLADDPSAAVAVSSVPPRPWIAWGAAALGLAAAAAIAFVHFREASPVVEPVRFQIAAPEGAEFDIYLALSPDGSRVAFTARDTSGTVRLWVHDLRTLESRVLLGTENAWSPFWSPDSRVVAFAVGRQLKKIDIAGGSPQTVCEIENNVGTGSWNTDDVIVFGSRLGGPIYRVPAAGGRAVPVTVLDAAANEQFHALPVFLPDGKHFIYLRGTRNVETQGIYVGALDVEPAQQSQARLVNSLYGASYAASASGPGRLLFVRDGALVAQPLDPDRRLLTGEPVLVAERVGAAGSTGFFSAAGTAALAFRHGLSGGTGGEVQLAWVDRQGTALGDIGERGTNSGMALSPDGKRVALSRATSSMAPDIWLIDIARNLSTRFTFDSAADMAPVWSPDSTRVVFRSNRKIKFDLYERAIDGPDEDRVVFESDQDKRPTDWSRDGRFILFEALGVKTRTDLWALPLQNPARPIAVAQSEFDERLASFSPDGRWIAYSSDESGRSEIYARPFMAPGAAGPAPPGGKVRISRDGALRAKWSADGREIVFRATGGGLMSVPVSLQNGSFEPGTPVQLFAPRSPFLELWDVAPDGKRFVIGTPFQQGARSAPITVVLNWQAGLGK